MQSSVLLQLFLLLDVFLIGVLTSTAIRHAYAHFRPHEPEPVKPRRVVMQNGHLPPAVRERMLEAAEANFQSVLNRSAAELKKDLESTAAQIKKHVEKLSTEATGKELEYYKTTIAELQQQTADDLGNANKELAESRAELKAKLAEEIAAEKQHLIQQIDTKLADAVASFLMETLQHNVDLGAQSAYLTTMLEKHKADIIKELADDEK